MSEEMSLCLWVIRQEDQFHSKQHQRKLFEFSLRGFDWAPNCPQSQVQSAPWLTEKMPTCIFLQMAQQAQAHVHRASLPNSHSFTPLVIFGVQVENHHCFFVSEVLATEVHNLEINSLLPIPASLLL